MESKKPPFDTWLPEQQAAFSRLATILVRLHRAGKTGGASHA